MLASQTISAPIVLANYEAASFDTGVEDFLAVFGCRSLVFSNRRDVAVVFQIIDRTTVEVVATFIPAAVFEKK